MLSHIALALSAALLSPLVFAAGNGGHGSVTDLIAPFVNVAILVSFLVWKLKKPLSDMFTAKAVEIENTLERASLKSKEAEVMLQAQNKKMATVDSEVKEILRQAEVDVKAFEKSFAREIEDKTFKLKSDASAKIEAEKKGMIAALNASLLDEVIQKAKATIRASKDNQQKASSKIFGEMLK
ncbi:MAG: hypothetical protein ACLGG7_02855 [Bacteriovoracia bacterium]